MGTESLMAGAVMEDMEGETVVETEDMEVAIAVRVDTAATVMVAVTGMVADEEAFLGLTSRRGRRERRSARALPIKPLTGIHFLDDFFSSWPTYPPLTILFTFPLQEK